MIFDDGTFHKELTAADFDALGQTAVRFVRPATAQTSMCHSTTAWQNGVLLGVH